jgi:hypothetical protein
MGSVSTNQPQYDVTADGRFLAAVLQPQVEVEPPVTVWLNATAALKGNAPR